MVTNFETPACSGDEEENLCSVCMTSFKLRLSRHRNRWMCVDAVSIDGLYYHPLCVKDTWKGVPVTPIGSVNVALYRND